MADSYASPLRSSKRIQSPIYSATQSLWNLSTQMESPEYIRCTSKQAVYDNTVSVRVTEELRSRNRPLSAAQIKRLIADSKDDYMKASDSWKSDTLRVIRKVQLSPGLPLWLGGKPIKEFNKIPKSWCMDSEDTFKAPFESEKVHITEKKAKAPQLKNGVGTHTESTGSAWLGEFPFSETVCRQSEEPYGREEPEGEAKHREDADTTGSVSNITESNLSYVFLNSQRSQPKTADTETKEKFSVTFSLPGEAENVSQAATGDSELRKDSRSSTAKATTRQERNLSSRQMSSTSAATLQSNTVLGSQASCRSHISSQNGVRNTPLKNSRGVSTTKAMDNFVSKSMEQRKELRRQMLRSRGKTEVAHTKPTTTSPKYLEESQDSLSTQLHRCHTPTRGGREAVGTRGHAPSVVRRSEKWPKAKRSYEFQHYYNNPLSPIGKGKEHWPSLSQVLNEQYAIPTLEETDEYEERPSTAFNAEADSAASSTKSGQSVADSLLAKYRQKEHGRRRETSPSSHPRKQKSAYLTYWDKDRSASPPKFVQPSMPKNSYEQTLISIRHSKGKRRT